jgi:hypothetical protein
MKKGTIIALLAMGTMTISAQDKVPSWLSNVRLSGFAMTKYQYSSQEGNESNSFSLRFARVSLDGRIAKDWYWKFQLQLNGNNTNLTLSPRVVDIFAEWQKYKFFQVKAGQFKRPFTFESPIHPIDQGFMGFYKRQPSVVFHRPLGDRVEQWTWTWDCRCRRPQQNAKGRDLCTNRWVCSTANGISTRDETTEINRMRREGHALADCAWLCLGSEGSMHARAAGPTSRVSRRRRAQTAPAPVTPLGT